MNEMIAGDVSEARFSRGQNIRSDPKVTRPAGAAAFLWPKIQRLLGRLSTQLHRLTLTLCTRMNVPRSRQANQ